MKVLVGDIGGTNARLAVYEVELAQTRELAGETFPSREYSSLADIVAGFMKAHGLECQRACFGVPGPVVGGRAQTTNLPWLVDASSLATAAGVDVVAVINDLKAQAFGIATLAARDSVVLNEGMPAATGNRALISAGTGLGQAGLYWDGHVHQPFACEGGHASFAPRGELQVALLQFLEKRCGHVSWERLISGPGLANIYDFLLEYRAAENPAWYVNEVEALGDPAPVITRAALEGRSELSVETLDLFVELFGGEAGNLALKIMTTGGLYVGGGIAPRIVDWLERGRFMQAFVDKGRMRSLLEAVPVRVIMNESTALLGAARYAVTSGAEV